MNIPTLRNLALLITLPLLTIACGPPLFTGAEVQMTVDDVALEYTTDDEIRHNDYTSFAEDRYTLDLNDEGLSLGWPSIEPGIYTADMIALEWEVEHNYNTLYYSLDRCDSWETHSASSITISANDYGLVAGYFEGYVCRYCGYECEDRIWIEGSFAASIEESWY
ncbi:hypothetical protein [Lujinxingia vulgaris]|nr:hypothetical protein [Lujinxingia vulgaris]